MKPLIFLAAIVTVAVAAAPAAAKKAKLPPYGKALRCAGLSGALLRWDTPLNDEARQRLDQALFWALAASDSARQAKITAPILEADLDKALDEARAELERQDAPAVAELAQCVREVPPLKGKKGKK